MATSSTSVSTSESPVAKPVRLRSDPAFFVTGGAHGIGAAFVRLAVARGARVAIGDVDVVAAQALAAACGERVVAIGLDVRDEGAWARALDEASARFGRLDVLVNNAGLLHSGTLVEQLPAQLQHMLDVNVLGVAYGLRAYVPRATAWGGGHVVDVASLASYVPLPGQAFYSATKHAVRALHVAFAMESDGPVTFTLVCPGAVETRMLRQQIPTDSNAVAFADRVLRPEQVAEAIWRGATHRPREILLPRLGGLGGKWIGVFPGVLALVMRRMRRKGLRALRARRRG
jgi:NAD(P)-dependent dehydrogenase (short-subunit alcohol dehydrogenase family)